VVVTSALGPFRGANPFSPLFSSSGFVFVVVVVDVVVISTVTPLVFSGIFYACNGRYHISYIDALFNCFSSMCCCGLATINLSSLTGWQQAILFIQMNIGNPVSGFLWNGAFVCEV
jgi:hypothetical protein